MKKKIILTLGIFFIIAFVTYKYVYKSHRDITNEKAAYSFSVLKIHKEFIENDSIANSKYLDKTITVFGKISSIDLVNKTITVEEKLVAHFSKVIPKGIKVHKNIIIKGRLLGFDDLLEELKLDQCSIE